MVDGCCCSVPGSINPEPQPQPVPEPQPQPEGVYVTCCRDRVLFSDLSYTPHTSVNSS